MHHAKQWRLDIVASIGTRHEGGFQSLAYPDGHDLAISTVQS
jgi:hypothetical protein